MEEKNNYLFSSVFVPTLKYPTIDPKLVNFMDYNYYLNNIKNDYFKELEYLNNHSYLHSAILNNLNALIFGTGFIPSTPLDTKILESYEYNEILENCISDYTLYGNSYLEIIWNSLPNTLLHHTKIISIKHIKYNQIMVGEIPENLDEPIIYYHCNNWKNWKNWSSTDYDKITPYIKFNPDPGTSVRQILPIKYNNKVIYDQPYYHAGLREIYTQIELSKFYYDLIKSGFSPNTIISIPGNLTIEQKRQLEYKLKTEYTGSEGNKSLVWYPGTKENEPSIIKMNSDDDGMKYHEWNDIFDRKIVSIHNLPSPLLVGISTPGQLGSNTELKNAYNLYRFQKVIPFRNVFLRNFNKLNLYLKDPLTIFKIDDQDISFLDEKNNP